ncbi:GIN domain-containing protein [Pseudoduganella danionis]|uniref:GIN domain-containing protein n=1 Tax=Pseudoduganella danionis TaxID=1890295 RepID=UPI00361529F5
MNETLDAEMSGSGDLSATAACKSVKLSIQGPGDIKLDGRTEQLTAQLNGSGNLNARQLLTQQTDIQVRGPGNAVVNQAGRTSGERTQLVTYERRGQRSTQ